MVEFTIQGKWRFVDAYHIGHETRRAAHGPAAEPHPPDVVTWLEVHHFQRLMGLVTQLVETPAR